MAIRSITRASIGLSAALCAFAFPGSASAQSLPGTAGSLAWSKSESILGAPSALEAILSEQHAAPAFAAVTSASFASASYSAPPLVQAIVHVPAQDDGALTGRPDVFGSVALRVGHTPLDAKWHSVEHAQVTGSPARFAAALKGFAAVEMLERVNNFVNHRVTYEDDQKHWGRPDVWSSANETLSSGLGDCEDYAIAKMQLLRAAGFPQHDLYLTIVHDLDRRADHAVLVARAAGHMYVLDDSTDEVLDSRNVDDYRPILTFASYGEWTHGYRIHRETAPVAPVAIAENDQRSRSASLFAFNAGFKR
ncbi:MAG TPA: transglutaminase-like cysteine peptidase [Sphingomicrobium sp.]|jgi:predicted transglutaminase-like cysteine proteinase|nr:transglutaminase-like cysteine peptidase [Sphingomicrobium sp.]